MCSLSHVYLLLAALVVVAVAKAPLHARDNTESVLNNYIVVLEPYIGADKANEYYKFLRAKIANEDVSIGYRGVTKTFDNVAYNAFHVECDEGTLDTIRDHPSVRNPF